MTSPSADKYTSRRVWVAAIAATMAAATLVGARTAAPATQQGRGPNTYTVALFGDMPYNALGKMQYPNLLADINANRVAFSVFDGDLKAGGDGACDDSLYMTALEHFNSLERPLIWLPGDNDWTDCWGRYGPGTGGFDPLERLAFERQLFTSTDQSLGQTTLTLARESSEGGPYAQYSENVLWKLGPVVYIRVNVQGSNDNYPYADVDGESRPQSEIDRQRAEEIARKAAVLHWLHEGFAYARQVQARGVMIVQQADLNFNNEQHLSDMRSWDAFPGYVPALASESIAFPGQVALVHGDSHYFKVDMPINGPSGGVLANFTRVETFGARNTHWVLATIDGNDPKVFRFEGRLVPANAQ